MLLDPKASSWAEWALDITKSFTHLSYTKMVCSKMPGCSTVYYSL